jgi:predicted aminopeptidase
VDRARVATTNAPGAARFCSSSSRTFLGLFALAGLALPGCGVDYIVQQGFGQLDMLAHRQPIARVLRDPSLPAEMRDRLTEIWYVRRFAAQALHLRTGESYQDLVRLDRDAASYVVSAAPPDSLEPYRWCFPIAGCLPYIGYFNRADAERERRRMAALGYDAAVRGVTAYSLGGWLPDPVYSSMLADSRGAVANTVIHELTHGTVFFPGRARFNEGVATFVGDRGELLFLAQHYGPRSRTLAEAEAEQADRRLYNSILHELVERLRALYSSDVPRAEKLRVRELHFADARARIEHASFASARYQHIRVRTLNNAVLGTFGTYFGAEQVFDALYERLGRDLPRFVTFVREQVAHASDPEAFISQWVRDHPGG